MHKTTQEILFCVELKHGVAWGALGASSCAPVAASIPQFFNRPPKKINKMGHSNTAEVTEASQTVQDLASFARHNAWAGGCASVSAGPAAVATASRHPRSAQKKNRQLMTGSTKLGFWMHRFIQEHVSCIELKVWMGWGAPGASRCSPVAAAIPQIFNRPPKNHQI